MRPSIFAVVGLVVSLSVVRDLRAQFATITPGSRVRLTTKRELGKRTVLVVDHVSADTLYFRREGGLTLPVLTAGLIDQLEISRRHYRPMWSKTAPLWFPLVGGVAMGTFAYQTDSNDDLFTADESFLLGAALGGIVGLVVGAGVAIGNTVDVWERVPVGSADRLSQSKPAFYLAPDGKGVRFGVGVMF